jgi:hypothetical protein
MKREHYRILVVAIQMTTLMAMEDIQGITTSIVSCLQQGQDCVNAITFLNSHQLMVAITDGREPWREKICTFDISQQRLHEVGEFVGQSSQLTMGYDNTVMRVSDCSIGLYNWQHKNRYTEFFYDVRSWYIQPDPRNAHFTLLSTNGRKRRWEEWEFDVTQPNLALRCIGYVGSIWPGEQSITTCAVRYNTDGVIFAVPDADNKVCIYKKHLLSPAQCITYHCCVKALALDSQGNLLALFDEAGTLSLYELGTGSKQWEANVDIQAFAHCTLDAYLVFSDNGSQLFVQVGCEELKPSISQRVHIFSARKGIAQGVLRIPNTVQKVQVSPDGYWLLVDDAQDGGIFLHSLRKYLLNNVTDKLFLNALQCREIEGRW